MSNVASIQAKLWRGWAIQARYEGANCSFHRGSLATSAVTDQEGNPLQGQDGAPIEPQGANDLLLDQSGAPLQAQDGSNPEDQSSNAGDPLLDQSGQPLLDQTGQVLTAQTTTPGPSPLSVGPYQSGMVSFNAEDMGYKKPRGYAKATWYALFDAANATVGDYIAGPQGTFFIAEMTPLVPILAVKCNRTITVYTPQDQSAVGAQGYGGSTEANRTVIMTGWPCSILQGTKGEKTDAKLPDDTRAPWWTLLLPYLEGVNLDFGTEVSDDLGREYTISSAELTDLGWRCTMQQDLT